MMALLSLILGFLAPSLKDIIKLWENKQDNAQELAIMQLQITANKEIGLLKLEEVQLKQDSEDLVTRYTPSRSSKWASNLNEITKSILALGIFATYVLVTYLYYQELGAMNDGAFFAEHMWTQEDYMIMFAIIGYYFGSTNKVIKTS